MRLPASVLSSLRLGLGATALLAGGCDEPEVDALRPGLARVEAQASAPEPTLAVEVAGLIDEAVRDASEARPSRDERVVFASPVAIAAPAEVDAPTAFVPFSADPRAAEPIRPRIRVQSRPKPAAPRPVSSSWRPSPQVEPTPTWDGDQCPACGRG